VKPTLIYQGNWISISVVTAQALEFVSGLTDAQWTDFEACSRTVDRSCELRRPSSRIERVEGSGPGLFELRVTPPGRRGPHVRLLYLAQRREFLVVRGLLKRQRRIGRREIELADRAATQYRSRDP
jgi:hypothetical protein